MATWIKATGTIETVTPAYGKEFTLGELQKLVGGYIKAVRLNGDHIMWVNEEGKLKGLPLNVEATRTAVFCALVWNKALTDQIVGDVVIANMTESGENDEDEGGDE